MALSANSHLINLPCRDVVIPLQFDVQEPLIVAQIQINLDTDSMQSALIPRRTLD